MRFKSSLNLQDRCQSLDQWSSENKDQRCWRTSMQSVTFRPQNSSSQKVIDTTISTKSCTWSRELP